MEETPSKRRLRSDSTKRLEETGTEENGGLPNFNLPSELVTKIMDMVPISQWASLESVSHQFQDIVHGLWSELRGIRLDELAYNDEKRKTKPHEVLDALLKKLLIRSPNVASISGFEEFCDGRKSIRLTAVRLLSKFEHLQTIDFSVGRMVEAKHFAVFLESSTSRQCWKSLNIDGIYGKMKNQVAVGNYNLPALNLECFKFKMEMLRIFDRCLQVDWSRLKKLVILDWLASAKDVLPIIRQCIQVAHLEVKVPKCGNGNGQVSFGNFVQALADLENLSVLKIIGSWSRDNAFLHDALLVLIQGLGRRRITDLALVACYCTDPIIDAIINYLPRLTSLELEVENCTTASLKRLANGMGQLETLKFHQCSLVVDGTVLRAIAGNISNLQCLHLDYLENCSKNFIILDSLRKLKELRVLGGHMDGGTVKTLTRLGFGSCLETLELPFPFCDDISPKLIGGFLKNMPRLRSLILSGATDDILQSIAESCPKLEELYLSMVYFTAVGVQSVIDCCSQLKLLKDYDRCTWFPSALRIGKLPSSEARGRFGSA